MPTKKQEQDDKTEAVDTTDGTRMVSALAGCTVALEQLPHNLRRKVIQALTTLLIDPQQEREERTIALKKKKCAGCGELPRDCDCDEEEECDEEEDDDGPY